jgi:hypothetical protein
MISIGDIVRYEDTDDWDTMRDEDDREVGIVTKIEDDVITIQWINSPTARNAEQFEFPWIVQHLVILSKG